MKNENSIYLSNMRNFRIWALFNIFFLWPSKNCIKKL